MSASVPDDPDEPAAPNSRNKSDMVPPDGAKASEGALEVELDAQLAELVPESPRRMQVVQRVMSVGSFHSGPLPPARELAAYERIHTGLANRVVVMAEKEQAHRHSKEDRVIRAETGYASTGLWMGGVVLVLLIGAATWFMAQGKVIGASAFLGTAALSVVVAIFRQRIGFLGQPETDDDKDDNDEEADSSSRAK